MDEQPTDAALRAMVARCVKAALGELIEEASQDDEESFVASLQSFLTKGELPCTEPAGSYAQRMGHTVP